jgi:hypothetical protein
VKVINLFAGPGAGKSTTAAYVFARLKMLEMNAELVTEYAKDLTWERIPIKNQVLVLGKQLQRLVRIQDQVDIAVTDSPLLLQVVYNGHVQSLDAVATDVFNEFDNLNYFITRTKPYAQVGRKQTETQAREFDAAVLDLLHHHGVPYKCVTGDQDGAETIVEDIVRMRAIR